ncbi:MAG: flavin-dependent oxidoreductase [Burkholderiales bacterium]|nr:flavin-dependent oxidoreductase [Burkholderiales bacterium]
MINLKTRLAIAGGGIGGLVLALQCHKHGIDCTVFEAVEKLEPLGVGINLLPHSVRILAGLGLLEDLKSLGVETAELAYFNKHGQAIWREPRGIAAGYDYPQISIHRGELHFLLLRHAVERLGAERIRTGHAIKRFDAGGDRAHAVFENRRTGAEVAEVDADLIVAADGIHSTVRALLYPGEGPPRYSGRVLWRGACVWPPFLTGRSMMQAGHANQKAVIYPISRKVFEETGNNLTNWIMELAVPGDTPPRQDWSKVVDKSVFAGPFAGWKWDWLDVPALIEAGGTAYEYPMCDRDPLPRWSFGRVTLLGDAAHPMYPIGSNGASQAILDTESLAAALTGERDVPAALARYEAERREATAKIVLANRGNGPDQVMQLAEERAPDGFRTDVYEAISRAELEEISARYKQTAGFAKAQVNARQ